MAGVVVKFAGYLLDILTIIVLVLHVAASWIVYGLIVCAGQTLFMTAWIFGVSWRWCWDADARWLELDFNVGSWQDDP